MKTALFLIFTLCFHFVSYSQSQNSWTVKQIQKFQGKHVDINTFHSKKADSFLRKLDVETLIQLTDDKDVGVMCYAFMALVHLNNNNVKDIFFEHLEDTRQVVLSMGESCLIIETTVNDFMLDQLHPVGSKNDYRLTREEYDELSNQIKN